MEWRGRFITYLLRRGQCSETSNRRRCIVNAANGTLPAFATRPHRTGLNSLHLSGHYGLHAQPNSPHQDNHGQPFLLQQVNNHLVYDFLSQQNNILFLFLSELMDLFVAGRDQSAADQPNNLAEGHPPL